MNDVIAKGRWVLGWEGTLDFYERHRDWLIGVGRRIKVPAFFKLTSRMTHYYAMKNEYQFITEDGSNVQISTVQWGVKDGERFNIGYTDDTGRKHPCLVILHASSFGSIERTLCAILENIAVDERAGVLPKFPIWLSPTRVRIIPVAGAHLSYAAGLCERIASRSVRADVDDREDTVGKRIRYGEKDWIPYLLVVGEKERSFGRLTVRSRADATQRQMTVTELVGLVHGETEGMPHRPLPLPIRVSQRPLFFG
jgi:threonyl-tRNA synthetase